MLPVRCEGAEIRTNVRISISNLPDRNRSLTFKSSELRRQHKDLFLKLARHPGVDEPSTPDSQHTTTARSAAATPQNISHAKDVKMDLEHLPRPSKPWRSPFGLRVKMDPLMRRRSAAERRLVSGCRCDARVEKEKKTKNKSLGLFLSPSTPPLLTREYWQHAERLCKPFPTHARISCASGTAGIQELLPEPPGTLGIIHLIVVHIKWINQLRLWCLSKTKTSWPFNSFGIIKYAFPLCNFWVFRGVKGLCLICCISLTLMVQLLSRHSETVLFRGNRLFTGFLPLLALLMLIKSFQ